MNNYLYFIIPGMYEHYSLNKNLLFLLKNEKHLFYDDIKIKSVYGNFQHTIFEGGRVFHNYNFSSYEKIEEIINFYNLNFNIPVRYVFTNGLLEEKHYTDRYTNILLELANNNKINEVVLRDDNLKKYIKDNFPNISFISSTTKCLNNTNLLKKELQNKDYKMVCLDYNLNHNFTFLNSLNKKEKEKCEFLVNAICPPGCPNRKKHYQANSIYNLHYGNCYSLTKCGIINSLPSNTVSNFSNTITPEELRKYYKKNKFKYFKLEGRTSSNLEQACVYAQYMALPEHKYEVILKLMKNLD